MMMMMHYLITMIRTYINFSLQFLHSLPASRKGKSFSKEENDFLIEYFAQQIINGKASLKEVEEKLKDEVLVFCDQKWPQESRTSQARKMRDILRKWSLHKVKSVISH